MKKIIITLLLVAFASIVSAQKDVLDFTKAEYVKPSVEYSVKGLSGSSAFLYMDLKSGQEELASKYDFVSIGGRWHVVALIDISSDNLSKLKAYDISVNGVKEAKFKSVTIPVEQFVSFVEAGIADYVDIGDKAEPQMDSARYYSHAQWVQNGRNNNGVVLPKSYSGKNVVVGIIDVGFDYTHRNFWNNTETVYRVKRVWDQNNSGTPPSGYNYGNEMTTQSAILAARFSHNNETHGSHVAGIAGGGGTSNTNIRRYTGMAPQSDLVFVSTNGNTNRLYDGITYVLNYAQSVGKPCVINLSWGSQIGPHDGKAAIDQNCDDLINNHYTEGSMIVVSAGNDGAKPVHVNKTFTTRDTVLRTFMVTTSYGNKVNNYLDIWGYYLTSTPYIKAVKVSVVDTQTSQVIATTRLDLSNLASSRSGSVTISNCTISYQLEPSSSLNNNTHVQLKINNSSETIATRKVMVEIVSRIGRQVHAWVYDAYLSSCGFSNAVGGNTDYSINAWGQANSQIMVASHNTKHYWRNARNGSRYYKVGATAVGARSVFSSIGPCRTSSIIKPDISAPGSVVVSSYNYGNSYQGQNTTAYVPITDSITNSKGGFTHYSLFGVMQGTSMAAPACAGILALWLEAYPQLTTSQAKWLFQNYSITDSYTGTIPSSGSVYFGRGKIDAFAGLNAILQKTAKPTITPGRDTVVCSAADSITFTAPAGYSKYYWSNGDTTRSIKVGRPGAYFVRAVSAEGFRTPNSDTVHITVSDWVTGSISPRDTTICIGDSVTLNINFGATRIWNNGDTARTITVAPTSTTTYNAYVQQPGYCPSTKYVTVTVRPYVATTISHDTAICPGGTASLSVSGGRSRTWSTGQNTTSIFVSPSTTTTYTVTSRQTNQCNTIDTVTVTVKTPISTTISPDTTICLGESVNLSVSGGTSWYWNTGMTSNSINVSPSTTTTYTVTSDSVNGCPNTDTVTVNVQPYVSTNISRDTAICIGETVNLTVSGGTSRTWSTGQATTTIMVTPSTTTSYTVTSNQANHCSTTDTVTVTVKPYVATTVTPDTAICIGQSITLNISGGTSRTWSNGSTGNSITVAPSTTTSYVVTSEQANHCSTTDTVTVTVKPYVATTISRDTAICLGESVVLSVTGGTSRTWSTGHASPTILVTPSTTTSYTVTSNQANHCPTTDTVTVTVKPYVATTISRDTAICLGESVVLSVTGGTSRTWSTGHASPTILVTPSTTTSYTVTSDQANHCSTTDTVTVTVKPHVATTISRDTAICLGESVVLAVTGGNSRIWSTGQDAPTILVTPSATTSYTVTSYQVNRCPTTDTVTVTIYPLPVVVISGDTVISSGNTATLTASGAYRYLWSTGATTNTINVAPLFTTRYSVEGTDLNGCRNNAHATVVVNTVSIASGSELEFKVYPIPTESKLTVEGESIKTITIYNILGKVIDKIECDGEKTVVLAVKDYAQGVYVISVADTKGQTGRRTFIVR